MENNINIIGILKERSLHANLKHHLEKDTRYHEIKYCGYVADILNDDGITEIQTRHFNAMRKKLSVFLETQKVTVVYPATQCKWLAWIDEQTGEVTKKRRSPKIETPFVIFDELYKIKPLLCHKNLHFKIIMTDIEEYRLQNGWSADKKRGSTRYERIPVAYGETIELNSTADYIKLIPPALLELNTFTSKDFALSAKISQHAATTAMNVLYAVGTVIRCGKTRKGYAYQLSQPL